ncbi:MAG: hypothetical protein OEX97_13995 [Acidimicrobiia bacterium]|nr:hypothetical protein [Acidimicrobiia bacterium]
MANMRSEELRQQLIDETGIDFASYQHEEFVDALDVTSSILQSIGRATKWASAALALVILVIWLSVQNGGGALRVVALAVIGVAIVAGFGALIWVRSLGVNLEAQIGELVSVTQSAAVQLHADLVNAENPPTDRQLADGLLLVMITPAVGRAVQGRVWLVGRPLGAMSERLVGNILCRMTARLEEETFSGSAVGSIAEWTGSVLGRVDGYLQPIFRQFRRWVIRPITAVLGFIIIVAIIVFVMVA